MSFKHILGLILFLAGGAGLPAAPAATAPAADFNLKEYERARVVSAADRYLQDPPITITAYPAARSAGGPHDYYSEGDYQWPDPKNPSGPYITRDGQTNPNAFYDHRRAMMRMSIEESALAAAWEITGDAKYARHALDHLRAWFVDPATLMNPSLPYAQAIRGLNTGRSIGIIDTLHLVEVARSIEVLRRGKMIPPQDDAVIGKWFSDYLHWLTTHPNGIKEGSATNNHATCYWLQVAAFAELTGDSAQLTECRKRYREQLLPQMAADGGFPRELKRTKPYGYSLFNLDQMTMLCRILSTPQENLWTYATSDGRTIRRGIEYMYPYVKDKSTWPLKPDVMFYQYWPVRSMTWLLAGKEFGEPKYIELWKSLEPNPTNDEVLRNLPIRQPVLWLEP